MKIDKALKKQNRYKKMFLGFMYFLAIILPIITYLAYIDSIYILFFLFVIEILIFLTIIITMNYYKLNFSCYNNKLKFKSGLFAKNSLIICDKVSIVHTYKNCEDMEIIIITTRCSKNKKLKSITKLNLKNYCEILKEMDKLNKINGEKIYYYQIIKRGALTKYILLDNIYKNCVNAVYTSSAIDNIKIARGQNEI